MGFGSSKQQSNTNSQQSSASLNQAYPEISSTFSPVAAQTSGATNAISSLLGLNGETGQNAAFDNYRNSSGYNFIRDQGLDGINSNNATHGLLGSGSALKGVSTYTTGLASQYLDKYLSQLSSLAGTGLTAGQVISGAGNTANSQGTSVSSSTGRSSNFSLG